MYHLKNLFFSLPSSRYDTHDELGGDDPIHNGTEKTCDDSDADEYYGCQELQTELKKIV